MKNLLNKFWSFGINAESIIVVLTSILFSVILTYPAILTLNTKFIGDGGDNYEYASYIGLAGKNLQQYLYPFLHSNFWRYPVGFDFSRGFDSYLTVIIGTLLSFLTSLVAAYNITILLLMVFNGVLSYIFFKSLTNSRYLAIIGMVMYGFSFYAIAKAASHPNLLFVGAFPLLGTAFIELLKKKTLTISTIILFFVSLILLSLGSTQYFVMAILFIFLYALFLIFINLTFLRSIIKKVLAKRDQFMKVGFVALCIFALLFFPHIASIINGKFVFLRREGTLATLTPSLFDYVLPNKYLRILPSIFVTSSSLPSIEKAVFIGFAELFFFVLFFFKSNITRHFKAIIFFLFLIPFVLSLGYGNSDSFFILPYRYLVHVFPFSMIVETGRYVVIFSLFIAIAAVIFLKSITDKRLRNTLSTIFLVALILERLPIGFYNTPTLFDEYTKIVRQQSSKAVLDIPINYYYPQYNILSLYYNKPVVNGYFHWSADGDTEKSFIVSSNLSHFICTNRSYKTLTLDQTAYMLNTLKENGITTIVVHKDDKFFFPECSNVRTELSLINPPVVTAAQTPQEKEQEIVMKSFSGKPQFNIYFPKTGTFYLGGVYIAPKSFTTFNIEKNGTVSDFDYGFRISKDNSMQLYPAHTISFPVSAGDKITFTGSNYVDSAYFSMWYRYIPDENTASLPLHQQFAKLFEDNKAIIYSIQ